MLQIAPSTNPKKVSRLFQKHFGRFFYDGHDGYGMHKAEVGIDPIEPYNSAADGIVDCMESLRSRNEEDMDRRGAE